MTTESLTPKNISCGHVTLTLNLIPHSNPNPSTNPSDPIQYAPTVDTESVLICMDYIFNLWERINDLNVCYLPSVACDQVTWLFCLLPPKYIKLVFLYHTHTQSHNYFTALLEFVQDHPGRGGMPNGLNAEHAECQMLRSWSLWVGAGMPNKNTAEMMNILNADMRDLCVNVVSYDFSVPRSNVCIGHGISWSYRAPCVTALAAHAV